MKPTAMKRNGGGGGPTLAESLAVKAAFVAVMLGLIGWTWGPAVVGALAFAVYKVSRAGTASE